MISASILEQLRLGMWCILYGVGITLLYDVLRIVRGVVPHGTLAVGIEDFLYWIAVALGVFLLLYYTNEGNLRWIAVVVIAFGMLLYKKIFGNFLVIFMSTKINQTLHLVVRILSVPLGFVKSTILKGLRTAKRAEKAAKNRLTGDIKRVNIILCKHLCKRKRPKKRGKAHEPQEIP